MNSEPSEHGNDPIEASSSQKLRKCSFVGSMKLLLLKCIREFDAHRAVHGKKDEVFEKVLERFINVSPKEQWNRMQKPKVKTIRDKFRTLLNARMKVNAMNLNATGHDEDVTETDQLLDDFILEIREHEENHRKTQGKSLLKDKALSKAGEEIQAQALERGLKNQGSSSKTKKRVASDCDGFDEWCESMKTELDEQKKLRRQEIALKKEELEVQKKNNETEEQKTEILKKQSDATIALMTALANKLDK